MQQFVRLQEACQLGTKFSVSAEEFKKPSSFWMLMAVLETGCHAFSVCCPSACMTVSYGGIAPAQFTMIDKLLQERTT